jgi:DNA-directed RNA polymerase sigma subunit (sigma70/sigma32)
MEAKLLRQDLEDVLGTLEPREAFVLRHRFGLEAAWQAGAGHISTSQLNLSRFWSLKTT